jgi:hypothetical protein
VRTDATGFAEVAYLDGSRTRLDVNTEFEVLALVDDAGVASTRTSMELGRTWHRVESVGAADGGFTVETSQATATVRGTAFAVECLTAEACRYVVAEGVVELALADGTVIELVAPSAVEVVNGVAGAVVAVPYDGVFGDPWLADNGTRDAAAGFADAATMYQAHGPAYASLSGTYSGTRTVTQLDCVAACHPTSPPVGDVAERSYTFAVDCSTGVSCAGTVNTEYMNNDQLVTADVPLVFDGATYTWALAYENADCYWDENSNGVYDPDVDPTEGVMASDGSWSMTPAAAEIRDGAWVVTALEGTATFVNVVTPGTCNDGSLGETNVATISVSR